MVDAVDTLTPPPTDVLKQDKNPSKAETDAKRLGDDFDTFLLLLTTQLKNQDPTEPLDTNEFTSQLVAFSGVEQQVATNKSMEKMLELMGQNRVDNGVTYIGKAIDAVGNKGFLTGGTGAFVYELPSAARDVQVSILSETGQVVFSGQGSTFQGKNLVTWDGKNSFTGDTMPDGIYQIVVKSNDLTGASMEDVKTYTTGRVTSAAIEEGQMYLTVGTIRVKLEDVLAVREIPVLPSLQSSNNSGNGNNTQ